MNEENKDMTRESAEQDFKNKMFEAFSKNNPGTYRDEEGFIVIPVTKRRKNPPNFDERSNPNN